jgi:putative hydrolase of the HAD superfamily
MTNVRFPMTDFQIPWPQIRAVTFDVGGTLIEPWPSVGDVYAGVAQEFGVVADADALSRGFARAWGGRARFNYSQGEWFEIVRETFGPLAGELPEAFFPAVYARFAEADVWRIYDDVEPALATLKHRGLRLGVISNWDERLLPLLDKLGLKRHFDVFAISHEAGHTKPAREIFDAAVARLGLEPGEVLHLGDREREDVEGARAAGLVAARVDRREGRGLAQLLAAGADAD